MKNGKEVRVRESASKDSQITGFNADEFFSNRLSLSDDIKKELTEKGLDWRFINASQFRSDGGIHRSHWRPYKFEGEIATKNVLSAEGYIQRGDLILATRPKNVSKAHKEFLSKRAKLQSNSQKVAADEMRLRFKEAGVMDQAKIHEGYEDND